LTGRSGYPSHMTAGLLRARTRARTARRQPYRSAIRLLAAQSADFRRGCAGLWRRERFSHLISTFAINYTSCRNPAAKYNIVAEKRAASYAIVAPPMCRKTSCLRAASDSNFQGLRHPHPRQRSRGNPPIAGFARIDVFVIRPRARQFILSSLQHQARNSGSTPICCQFFALSQYNSRSRNKPVSRSIIQRRLRIRDHCVGTPSPCPSAANKAYWAELGCHVARLLFRREIFELGSIISFRARTIGDGGDLLYFQPHSRRASSPTLAPSYKVVSTSSARSLP